MSTYIIAQLIGAVGYFFYISAPHLESQQKIIKVEAFACGLLCIQWFLMMQYSLLVMNILIITVSISALWAQDNPYIRTKLPLLYPLGVICLLCVSKGTIIDLIAITAFCLTVTSKLSTCIFKFRMYAGTTGLLITTSSIMALAWPAAIFNAMFALGHGRKLALHHNTSQQTA
ncbi:MAG: hypothetical protein ACRBDL_08645 [Alphaproteobacteria bacterium]